jgi:uncharacterized membrane protein YfcA
MVKLELSKRTTAEIIVLLFTFLICVVMFVVTLGTIIAKMVHPEMEVSKAAEAINNMLSTIIGALVGFISGRAYGRREQEEKDRNGPQNKVIKQ